jgi:hypothetical protein
MTQQEIEEGFKKAIQEAVEPFYGEKMTQNTLDQLRRTAQEAAYRYYESIPHIYVDQYEIQVPMLKVMANGSIAYVENQP